jgi:hypothetical protein
VVWNIYLFFHILGIIIPTEEIFRGVETTSHTLAIHHCLVKKMEKCQKKYYLVGGLELFYFPFHIWDGILPIDELNHFSRWAQPAPPTSHHPQESAMLQK